MSTPQTPPRPGPESGLRVLPDAYTMSTSALAWMGAAPFLDPYARARRAHPHGVTA